MYLYKLPVAGIVIFYVHALDDDPQLSSINWRDTG
jgi:hypothetical protein